jgi:branched-subunit amino acid transport protein AzlD
MVKQEYNFQYPIEYIKNKTELKKNVVDDLELIKFNDIEEVKAGISEHVVEPKTVFGKQCISELSKYTTTDIEYLKDTQVILKNYPVINQNVELHDNVAKIWYDIINDGDFINKYKYIDMKYFEKMNNSSLFLQLLSIYNLSSPIMFFIVPLVMLLVPFFILKFKRLNVSMNSYVSLLKKVLKNHTLGLLLNTNYKEINWGTAAYVLFSIGFYLFQMYQNVISCVNYYKNMHKIHDYIFTMKEFLIETRENIIELENIYNAQSSYKDFTSTMVNYKIDINKYIRELNDITPMKINFAKGAQLGYIMKHFHMFYKDENIHKVIDYAFHLNGYIDYMVQIKSLIKSKKMNPCTFGKITKIKKGYYAKFINDKYVSNDFDFKNNMIITGPNAAGKTTLIKTSLINIIFSQQIGFGFYKKAVINPYDHIHSYLNIPDTSGRDSLFQAEARRCKEIIDQFNSCGKERHICIFDELYSGTNPYEAVGSAYGFLKYINNRKNIDFMITTHYGNLCNLMENEKNISNKHMKIELLDNNYTFNYTYKMAEGISQVKGGFKVLKDLEYPDELLDTIQSISNKLI